MPVEARFLVLVGLFAFAARADAQTYPNDKTVTGAVHISLSEPMRGVSLAGPRAQTALGLLGFGEFAALSAVSALGGQRNHAVAFAAAGACSLGLGIWGALRLRARRRERHRRMGLLPPHIAMAQRDVRLRGPRVLIALGTVFSAAVLAIPPYIIALTGDRRAGLVALPYLTMAAPFLGLGIRRLRERRALRARFIGNGVVW